MAAVILAVTMAGLVNVFVSGKRWLMHERARTTGGELGKLYIDPLQLDVRQDSWNNAANTLTITGTQPRPGNAQQLGALNYGVNYTVTNVTNQTGINTGIRKVVSNITWDELTF